MQIGLADIVRGTPWWVFAVFGVLLWFGIRGLTLNARKIGVIWITPAFFIAWGMVGLVQRSGSVPHWLIGAAVGMCLGVLVSVPVQVDPRRKLVVQPGSVIPLIRNVSLFAAHYVLNVLAAIKPHLSAHYMAYDVYISGMGTGYFIGWASRFIASYRQAMRPDSDANVRVLSGVPPAG